MKCVAVLFLTYLHIHISHQGKATYCTSAEIPDYYWREFRGVIPFDAIAGGKDRLGLPTYIGQAMVHPWGQLPASIYHGNRTAVASAALKTFYVDKNVKILCSGTPERFRWIPTDTEKIQLITNCDLIPGGVDLGHQENIGRVNYNDELLLGKVIRQPLSHDGLWVPTNNTEIKFKHYEVLAYGCTDDVDIRAST